MRVTEPGYVPPSEEYWTALMEQGEFARWPAPEAEPEEIWEGLGMGQGRPIPMPGPWDLGAGEPDWRAARACLESGQPLTVTVVGYNRGGLIVQAEGLPRGFVPASHLLHFPNALDGPSRASALARYIGQTLQVRAIEVDEVGGRFVLSERLAHQDPRRVEALFAELRPGQVRRGVVTKVTSFGAFVDLGGFEGLLHLSEMSWGRVNDPGEVVRAGQELEVLVLEVNPQERRVSPSSACSRIPGRPSRNVIGWARWWRGWSPPSRISGPSSVWKKAWRGFCIFRSWGRRWTIPGRRCGRASGCGFGS
jgi:small subunit ribosomal protein S1